MNTIDLHMHSTASDGSLEPARLMDEAHALGLETVALTDHDTVSGLGEARLRAERLGMEFISGVEISAAFEPGAMHVLGYFFDPEDERFSRELADLQAARRERNPKIIEKLRASGIDISYDEVVRAAGGGQVGRPHFAKVLVEKKVVRSFRQAFEKYLKKGGAAYVDKRRLSPEASVRAISRAGGAAVVAHPAQMHMASYDAAEALFDELKGYGLAGIEVYHSSHKRTTAKRFRAIAERLDLVATGGSDFHGQAKKYTVLGRLGSGKVLEYEVINELRRRAEANRN